MRILLFVAAALALSACVPSTRHLDPHPPTFTHAVIDTRWDDDRAALTEALAPYFVLTTTAQAYADGVAEHTLLISMHGMPGLWGSEVSIDINALQPRCKISAISAHHGIVYAGRHQAAHDALQELDPEARSLSAKMHLAAPAPSASPDPAPTAPAPTDPATPLP